MALQSINPSTGETLATFEEHSAEEIDERLAVASRTFQTWRRTAYAERAAHLQRAAEVLDGDKHHWGEVMTREMGKPIGAAAAEAEKCSWVCHYYAEHAAHFLQEETVATDARHSFIRYEPLGPVLAVMPWNFPFWQVFRFAAPALMAGNVGLLKHASNVPQCALAIEEVLHRAGFPAGVFQTLLVGSRAVDGLVADPRIAAVTLTGSEGAGRAVAAAAGKAIKKTVLELGGSDPFIILPSADLERATTTAVQARIVNNGQSCIAAKRFIVHREIADAFLGGFLERMKALRIGDPMDPQTEIGPLATPAILQELTAQVEASVSAGAGLLLGGKPLARTGNFYPPTVLLDPPAGCPAADDELFGPVAAAFVVDSIEQAIVVANRTRFGLGASAWTHEPAEIERLAHEIEAGAVFLNGMVKSDPRLPFGGVKQSGYGRELAQHGIREFVNVKTVWIG